MADEFYYDFGWGLYVIRDDARSSNWQTYSKEELGLVPGVDPIWVKDKAHEYLANIPASRRAYFIKSKGKDVKGGSTKEKNGVYLPKLTNRDPKWADVVSDKYFKNYGHPMRFTPTAIPTDADKKSLLEAIRSITTTTSASYMHNSFPQMLNQNLNGYTGYNLGNVNSMRDMLSVSEFVEYRCQDIFSVVFADGNRVNDLENRKAAYIAATTHPKNEGLDKEGKPFNGPDFPYQYVFTGGVGVDKALNDGHYQNFAKWGAGISNASEQKDADNGDPSKGKPFYVVSENADEIGEYMYEFIESRRPRSFFSSSAPAVSSYMGGSKNPERLIISLQVEGNRWVSYLKMSKTLSNGQAAKVNPHAHYAPYLHQVIGQSPSKGGWLSLTHAKPEVLKSHFNNASLGLPKKNVSEQQYLAYLPWLTTSTQDDKETGYRTRAMVDVNIPGAESKSANNEFRYTGNGLSTNLLQINDYAAMLGDKGKKAKVGNEEEKTTALPKYLIYGSNDGMVKIYKTLKNEDTPYQYVLGILPGNMKQTDSKTLYQSMYLRSRSDFGRTTENPHSFGINGGIGTRLTNEGQLFSVTSLGQGGKGVFAFNIAGKDEVSRKTIGIDAKSQDWAKSVPMWTSSEQKSLESEFGYVTGSPIVAPISLYRDVNRKPTYTDVFQSIITSSGLDGDEQENAALVINAVSKNYGDDPKKSFNMGDLIQKVKVKSNLEQHYGFSAPAVVDLDLDGIADVAYFGDRNGDVYRFDMRYSSPELWQLHKVFSGNPQLPVSTAPTSSIVDGKRVVAFVTGSTLYSEDITNKEPQKIVVFEDKLDFAPVAVGYQDLRDNQIQDKRQGHVNGLDNEVWIRDVKVKMDNVDYLGWALTLPVEVTGGKFKGKELGNIGLTAVEGSLFVTTNILKAEAFANAESGEPVVCFRDLTTKGGSVMALSLRDGGTPSKKELHLTGKVNGFDTIVAGYVTHDITSPVLVASNHRNYVTNNDGVFGLYNELASSSSKTADHVKLNGKIFSKEPNDFISDELSCAESDYGIAVSVGDETYYNPLDQGCGASGLRRISWHEIGID